MLAIRKRVSAFRFAGFGWASLLKRSTFAEASARPEASKTAPIFLIPDLIASATLERRKNENSAERAD